LDDRIDRSIPMNATRDRLSRVRERTPYSPPDLDEIRQSSLNDEPSSPRQQAFARRELERAVREVLGSASVATLSPDNLAEMVGGVAEQSRSRFAGLVRQQDWDEIVAALPSGLSEAGILGPLLQNQDVAEIMVNGPGLIFFERLDGRIDQLPHVFYDEDELVLTVNTMLAQTGRRLSPNSPMVDGRLLDGSRLHAVHNVLSPQGTCVTIRKFRDMMDLAALLRNGTFDARMARFLKACILSERSLLISGGTGTGKTTLLNALLELAPREERLVAVEAVSEIRFKQPNAVNLEARPPSSEGQGAVGQRELVQNALRMRPDRIIVGEVRGGEALDLLQAMNTGHPGSMGTIHANSPRDALRRMETLTLLSGVELPLNFVARLVCEALDFVVHLDRDTRGNRRLAALDEVVGLEGDTIVTNPIFGWRSDPSSPRAGRHVSTGIPPVCLAELAKVDDLPSDFFSQDH